jgi:hypothetical protein
MRAYVALFLACGPPRLPHDLYVVLLGRRFAHPHGCLLIIANGRMPLSQFL